MTLSRAERALVTDWWLTVDRSLLSLILLLPICGAVAALVATPQAAIHFHLEPFYFAKRHVIAMVAAVAVVFAVSLLNPVQIRRLALAMFLGGLLLMAAALLQGFERNGATRWLILGGVFLQPSEFAKPGFVVLSAWLFSESIKRPDMPAIELSLLALAIFLALLVRQPDIGQAIIISGVWCGLFFLAGYSMLFLPLLGGACVAGFFGAYAMLPHFANRIDRFFGTLGDGQQMTVAAAVFRDAGWFGHGLGEGFTKTRLPDAHNDYVFAALAEELGIAACLFLILIYALIVWKVLRSAFREENAFLRLAITGLIMIFGFQALINVAVNLNLLPTKGVTLPFISYGRSSLISSAVTLGMILGLTRRSLWPDPAHSRQSASESGMEYGWRSRSLEAEENSMLASSGESRP